MFSKVLDKGKFCVRMENQLKLCRLKKYKSKLVL